MPSYEKIPPQESPEIDPVLKEQAQDYFKKAFDGLSEDDKQGIAVLLMNMQFDRATNGELLSDAFSAIGDVINTDERFIGPKDLDNRVERLFGIIDHDNKLVGKNLTVLEAREILEEKGYDGSLLSGMQYNKAKN